ncbi:MAG: [protein-PII] uridylyltransferase, partial [Deltaproteobacteria bacterium]|nr:[protein-PII] uridylyltransferase [Deltaproteobacteria bacterium]
LIIQFARSMQDIETLNMLFLLTWADIRAVGPDVWTPWKGSLLTELHKRTRTILESGDFTRAALDRKIEEVKSQVTQLLGTDLTEEERESFLKNMPPKYFLSQTPEEIVRHLKLISHAGSDQMMMDVSVSATENVNELLLYTLGTPGLLAKTAGTMTANDLNILEAKQSVSKNGQALVHFIFTDAQGKVIQEERRLQNLKKDLLDLLENRVRVSQLIESRKKPVWMQKKLARTFPAKVEIDNDVSAYYTVIDIYAHDRIGLLYEILTTLSNLGLYVDVSKISTKVDQAADVFYVKDIFGQKVTQSEKIKRIRAELLKSVEGEV